MKEQAILNAFTETSEGLNETLNKLTVKCVNSTNNKFSLDCDGNLSVNSITTRQNGTGLTMNDIYPVGAIYLSMTPTSPATLFGGTWERIKDRFLLGAGDNHSVNETGGEEMHTLTGNEMPYHNHAMRSGAGANKEFDGLAPEDNPVYGDTRYYIKYQGVSNTQNREITTGFQGGSWPHNNMPPYLSVYMWKRIS